MESVCHLPDRQVNFLGKMFEKIQIKEVPLREKITIIILSFLDSASVIWTINNSAKF